MDDPARRSRNQRGSSTTNHTKEHENRSEIGRAFQFFSYPHCTAKVGSFCFLRKFQAASSVSFLVFAARAVSRAVIVFRPRGLSR